MGSVFATACIPMASQRGMGETPASMAFQNMVGTFSSSLACERPACFSTAVAPASSSGIFGVVTSGDVWRRLEATPQVFLAASGDSLTSPRPD